MVTAAESAVVYKRDDGVEVKKKKKKKKRKYSQVRDDFEVAGNMSGASTTSALEVEMENKTNLSELADQEPNLCKTSNSTITDPDMQPDKDVHEAVKEKEVECSAMEIAIRKTLEAVIPVTVTNEQVGITKEKEGQSDGQKRKRRRTRRRKKKSNASEVDSFHESSIMETSTPTAENNGSNQGKTKIQKQSDCNESYQVNNFGATHVKFGESDDEEPVNLNTAASDSVDKMSGDAEKSEFNKDVECELNSANEQKSTNLDKAEIKCKGIQPTVTKKTNGENSFPKHVGKLGSSSKSDVNGSYTPKATCVTTFQKGPFASVKVFSRKLNKKAGSVPLTKEEQLNSIATNKSTIFQVCNGKLFVLW